MKTNCKSLLLILIPVLFVSCGKTSFETKPVRKNITETVFASGVLVPENQYNLTSQTEGYLTRLNIEESDTVKKGDLLGVIDNEQNIINSQSSDKLLEIASANSNDDAPALRQSEINLNLANQKLIQDKKQADRYSKLFETNSVSKLEYENVLLNYQNSQTSVMALQENYKLLKQQADQQLIVQKSQKENSRVSKSYNEIRAVMGGMVYKMKKLTGDYVRKGDLIAVMGNPKKLYALLSVDENNISKIKLFQQVIIQLNTQKEKTYRGKVTEIYPSFDEQTQSFYCKVEFTDTLDFKISGTQLQGNIITENKNNILVIPRNYLGYGNKVKVKDLGETTVETGFISNEWVEILKGLDESSVILTETK